MSNEQWLILALCFVGLFCALGWAHSAWERNRAEKVIELLMGDSPLPEEREVDEEDYPA